MKIAYDYTYANRTGKPCYLNTDDGRVIKGKVSSLNIDRSTIPAHRYLYKIADDKFLLTNEEVSLANEKAPLNVVEKTIDMQIAELQEKIKKLEAKKRESEIDSVVKAFLNSNRDVDSVIRYLAS